MAKKEKKPQYITSPLNTQMLNYQVYVLGGKEKLLYFLLAFVAGGLIGLTFYGGLFRNSEGEPTFATTVSNFVVFVTVGLIAVRIYIPMRIQQLKDKGKKELTQQFRSLLEALAVSLSSGMNMVESLQSAIDDLRTQYSADAYIVKEVAEMIGGIQNNIPIEVTMSSLGERSEIEDIKNFSSVFSVGYRAGGNLKDIVRRTNSIISEKIEISGEIETALSSNKTQFSAMMVIPVVMVLLLKAMSSDFAAGFSSAIGVVAITVAVGIFVVAYKLGQKIMDIKG
jgi:tight adherence protein B